MDNRFKFRVPVVKNNEFDGYVYINLGEKLPKLHGGYYGKPEQCTGLYDTNNCLIYENDIVKIDSWDVLGPAGYRKEIGIVEWDSYVAGFNPMCNYACDCGVYHEANRCEIIGNILQNPELSERK